MRSIKTITFVYEPREDRILAAINAGRPDAWACWLTRRMVLPLLERGSSFVAGASQLVKRTPNNIRGEMISFERDAAIATTEKAMSPTPPTVVKDNRGGAVLLQCITIKQQGEKFLLQLCQEIDVDAEATLTSSELQRILLMLEMEAGKANWMSSSPDLGQKTKSMAADQPKAN